MNEVWGRCYKQQQWQQDVILTRTAYSNTHLNTEEPGSMDNLKTCQVNCLHWQDNNTEQAMTQAWFYRQTLEYFYIQPAKWHSSNFHE